MLYAHRLTTVNTRLSAHLRVIALIASAHRHEKNFFRAVEAAIEGTVVNRAIFSEKLSDDSRQASGLWLRRMFLKRDNASSLGMLPITVVHWCSTIESVKRASTLSD